VSSPCSVPLSSIATALPRAIRFTPVVAKAVWHEIRNQDTSPDFSN
jgi:hypothetical protein